MRYSLKKQIDLTALLNKVSECSGAVIYENGTQVQLDLSDSLCRYMFLTLDSEETLPENCCVECSEEDALILSDYILSP